jgi:hypothetical protein
MNDNIKPATLFWVISGLALLWYIFGTLQFVGSLMATQEGLQPMIDKGDITQAYATALLTIPGWVKAAFGAATISGVLGSISLLLRKKTAVMLFIISLLAALIMYLYLYVLSGNASVMPASDYIIAAAVTVVTISLIFFSRKKTGQGILA